MSDVCSSPGPARETAEPCISVVLDEPISPGASLCGFDDTHKPASLADADVDAVDDDDDDCGALVVDDCADATAPVISAGYDTPEGFSEWAPCKQQAWLQLDTNPNAFFYRHVMPGEERRNGPWTEAEKALFLRTLAEHPVEGGHWGMFARHIPGRVGYQCNAFFKKLVAAGVVDGPPQRETVANPDGSVKRERAPRADNQVLRSGIAEEQRKDMTDHGYMYDMSATNTFHFTPSETLKNELPFRQTLVAFLEQSEENRSLFCKQVNPYKFL